MSDIRANTISDAAGTGPIDLYKQSAAKAWAKIDVASGTPSVTDGFNTASVVDVSAGRVTVNLSSAMSNDDFALAALVKSDGLNLYTDALEQYSFNRTNSSFQLSAIRYDNGTPGDPSYYSSILQGDLA